MNYKKNLDWVYAIGALLIIGGAIMKVFFHTPYSSYMIFGAIVSISFFQSWVIAKLEKQLKETHNNNNTHED